MRGPAAAAAAALAAQQQQQQQQQHYQHQHSSSLSSASALEVAGSGGSGVFQRFDLLAQRPAGLPGGGASRMASPRQVELQVRAGAQGRRAVGISALFAPACV
jgi:hypothetical protein